MLEPTVSAREFERWMQHLDSRFDRAEARLDRSSRFEDDLNTRVQALETNQTHAGKLSAKLSTIVSLMVTALVSGVLHFLGGR